MNIPAWAEQWRSSVMAESAFAGQTTDKLQSWMRRRGDGMASHRSRSLLSEVPSHEKASKSVLL
jgi:hypothetical protein